MVTHACNLNCVYCFEKHKALGKRFMTFETAQQIISSEIMQFQKSDRNPTDRLSIEFFGGEPLLNFPLIKKIFDWVESLPLTIPIMFQTTTNGTMFNEESIEWFTTRKDFFRVVLSIDGNDDMQHDNRGCSQKQMPLEYIVANWPNSYFKMTVSAETLPRYAEGIIDLAKKGYKVPSSLAEGVNWTKKDAEIYRSELIKIADFYLENEQYTPDQPFDYDFSKVYSTHRIPIKNCGVGTNVQIYDTDGKAYPCHLFLPIVHGDEKAGALAEIDFRDDSRLVDDHCIECPLVHLCRTCYGYNQIDRGDVRNRNLTKCKMLLNELDVISCFQIKYFMKHKDSLSREEMLKLDAAIRCHEIIAAHSFCFE